MLKTSGFVLRKNNYREYDRIYTLYTSDYGKVSLLARGARKIKSKLSPHLEGLNEVRLNFAKGKIFNHLSGANVVSLNKGLLNDGEKIAFISDCFLLLDRFIKPEEGDRRIYDLMKEVFGALVSPSARAILPLPEGELEGVGEGGGSNQTAPNPSLSKEGNNELQKIRVYFFWRLVDLLGYRPQLDECALCGRPSRVIPAQAGIQSISKFDITDNIVICGNCIGDGIFIQENVLNNLKRIFEIHLADFLKIELDNQLVAITEKAKQIKLSEL